MGRRLWRCVALGLGRLAWSVVVVGCAAGCRAPARGSVRGLSPCRRPRRRRRRRRVVALVVVVAVVVCSCRPPLSFLLLRSFAVCLSVGPVLVVGVPCFPALLLALLRCLVAVLPAFPCSLPLLLCCSSSFLFVRSRLPVLGVSRRLPRGWADCASSPRAPLGPKEVYRKRCRHRPLS